MTKGAAIRELIIKDSDAFARSIAERLEKSLANEITHPCPYHPAGRNHLLLNPQERAEVIKRVLMVIELVTK